MRTVALTAAGPPGRDPGHAGQCRPPRRTGPCSAPSPTMPRWPWSGPSSAEQALRSELLEEVDRLRHALVGAVSHDLRTPLATMKVASSTLLNPDRPVSDADADELHGLIDVETDRLTRLVTSLLDMTRIDAGVLEVRRAPDSRPRPGATSPSLPSALRSATTDRMVDIAGTLPDVDVDQLLIGQVLANLLGQCQPPRTRRTA